MDKFELKEKLIALTDNINKMVGEMMSKSVTDEETARIRSTVYVDMFEMKQKLDNIIYNIY